MPRHLGDDFGVMLQFLQPFGIKKYLEIGSHVGGSLVVAHEVLQFENSVCVDLEGAGSGGYSGSRKHLIAAVEKNRIPCTVINGDSHDPDVVKQVQKQAPFDLVYIDGDHSFRGALMDYLDYSPMARFVAMDDVHHRGWPDVGKAWRSIVCSHDGIKIEFSLPQVPNSGVGLLIKKGVT